MLGLARASANRRLPQWLPADVKSGGAAFAEVLLPILDSGVMMKTLPYFALSGWFCFAALWSSCSAPTVAVPDLATPDLATADPPGMDLSVPDSPDLAAADLLAGDLRSPASAPALSSVTPDLGPTAGGTVLTIDGQNFVPESAVTIAGVAVSQLEFVSTTQLKVTLPARAGAWGRVPVSVKNPDSQQSSRSDLFSYYASQVSFPSAHSSNLKLGAEI